MVMHTELVNNFLSVDQFLGSASSLCPYSSILCFKYLSFICFRICTYFQGMSQLELEDEVQDDLKRATGEFTKDGDDANKLNRILQLTGFSDPVYAEAYVTVHHYDIVLDVTVINRTKETLQNLCLELATMGDLKLVERPQNYTLAPESSKQIKANIKVSSTETGVIFGNIVYETSSNVLERNVIVLNDIHIDIMDYISPASCADVAFRTMWAEFEWENKVRLFNHCCYFQLRIYWLCICFNNLNLIYFFDNNNLNLIG